MYKNTLAESSRGYWLGSIVRVISVISINKMRSEGRLKILNTKSGSDHIIINFITRGLRVIDRRFQN